MPFRWPDGFSRIPDEDWTRSPIGELARKYDTVETHGWYRNLDHTVRDLSEALGPDDLLLDYSGGTGILAGRLLEEAEDKSFGILIVDASPKFLRLAVDKLGKNERIAFRWLRYLKPESRLQTLQESIEPALLDRGVDAIASTNAIHLYYQLEETLRSWRDILRSRGRVFVQSGNIGVPDMPDDAWIIDETVEAIHEAACQLVRERTAWAAYREVLDDAERMEAYGALRRKFFLPVRPMGFYTTALEQAGLEVTEVAHEHIEADVDQWYEFLAAYHEGVLGWVGGSRRVEGEEPSEAAVEDRLELMRLAMERVFMGASEFDAIWTYIRARRS